MTAIDKPTIDRANSNIEATIGKYLQLVKSGSEFKACCPFHDEKSPSFTVVPSKGFYHCFGCGESGDSVQFVMQYTGKSFREAVESIIGQLPNDTAHAVTNHPRANVPAVWEPLTNTIETPPASAFEHYRLGYPVATYHYRTADGITIGYVCRFENDGKKETLPLCLAVNTQTGVTEWRWLSFAKPRPLYGLDRMRPDKNILLVEGEKTADAARLLFSGMDVLTWPGGANAVAHADFTPLAGRSVVMWPDADDAGIEAMRRIYQLHGASFKDCRVVPVSDQLPKGWDLADDAPDGFDPVKYAKASIVPAGECFIDPEPAPEPIQPPAKIPTYLTVDYYSPLPDANDKGKPLSTIENLEHIISRLGVNIRYNVISKNLDVIIPESSYSADNNENACLAWMMSECARFKYPDTKLPAYMLEIGDRNQYNPVKIWVESIPWDGLDRLTILTNSLGSKDPELTGMLLKKWMVGAIHAAYSPSGIDNSSVLVLQGEQYAGKTAWFKSLLGDLSGTLGKEGAIVNPTDKDSVLGVVKYWLVELGELDATFRRADIAVLKSFITRDSDELRKPYAAGFSKYPRRTMFFASVNPKTYLHDETGSRRFWTVECTKDLNPNHGIDVQQAWAQVKHMYDSGYSWKLSKDEMTTLNEHNEGYQSVDPIEDLLLLHYDCDPLLPRPNLLSASEILVSIGYERPNNIQSRSCGTILRKYFGDPKKTNGRQLFAMPIKKEV
jgi:putative DNA primase/helicase